MRARTRFLCFHEAVSIRAWASLGLAAAVAVQVGCSDDAANDGAGGATSASGSAGTPTSAGGGGSSAGQSSSSGGTAGGSSVAGSSVGGGGSAGQSSGGASGSGAAGGGAAGGGAAGGGAGGGAATGKGAAAKWVCQAGATYGEPLAGMGTVASVAAPQGDYFAFLEGPIWIASTSTLYFSDNAHSPTENIFKLVPPSTTAVAFVPMSGSKWPRGGQRRQHHRRRSAK